MKISGTRKSEIIDMEDFFYNDGTVSKELLEQAIDFMISIEPDPELLISEQEYEAILERYESQIKMVNKAVRQYAYQIQDKTLKNMQEEFYSITNQPKYTQSYIRQSVAYNLLHHQWDGIGPWMR